jgi:Fic family protein
MVARHKTRNWCILGHMPSILKEIDLLQEEINRYHPLDPVLLKQIRKYYKIGLTYSSNALEGNTLTESETKIVLEEGITISGKPLKDHLEALGHAEGYDYLQTLIEKQAIEETHIRHLHKLIFFRIDSKEAGHYRKSRAIITGSKYPLPKPEELESFMEHLISTIQKIRQTKHPVVAAALIHKEFVFIHPFFGGNGRVARFLMNLILLQEGFTVAVIPPAVRREYIDTLELAHTNDQEFITLIAQMVKETQKDYLRLFLK